MVPWPSVDTHRKFYGDRPIVGDFNFGNILWYPEHGFGASAKCSSLNDNEMAFVSSLRENLLRQHVVTLIRQRGIDTPHILDLVITYRKILFKKLHN